MERLNNLSQNLTGQKGNLISVLNGSSPDDVVICGAYRTALAKAGRGQFKETAPEILISTVLKGLVEKTGVDVTKVEDMMVGNCLQPGAGALIARAAQLMAGFPVESTVAAVNRQCSSGIEACSIIASKIKAGVIDVGIGAGVECMSLFDMNSMVDAELISDELFDHEVARNCLQGMGMTSENVAKMYNLKRERMDEFAAESQRRALHAQKNGWFDDEIIPVKTTYTDKEGKTVEVTVTKDGGIRPGTTAAKLSKLRPSFGKDGISTAGNSSQTTDGAAVVLLARRSVAEQMKLKILGKFVAYAVAGVPPEIMGVGPAYAIPKIFEQTGLNKDDIDVYEINEAFATQATWSCDKLGLDYAKVNPRGGAIALGHPLGCTGARMVSTLLSELRRTDGKYGIISMCIGTGMGAAALIERC
jgi:acetyl-CoA acyltransferase 1